MRFFQMVIALGAFFMVSTLFTQAQDEFDYGIPISEFPTPPNQETANVIINYKLDHMGLNPGMNEIHLDEISGVKLFAYVKPNTRDYTILAKDKDKQEIPLTLRASENPSCIFAIVGKGWVNVLCSDLFLFEETAYDEARKEKEEAKKQKQ
ncbi:MAG: hypothetical protein ACPGXL_04375 [Chitinophagales bacterium]